MAHSSHKAAAKLQAEKFIETARELGCDESEEAFAETLKRVGRQRPPDEGREKGEKLEPRKRR